MEQKFVVAMTRRNLYFGFLRWIIVDLLPRNGVDTDWGLEEIV